MANKDLVGTHAPQLELPCATTGSNYKLPLGSKKIALFFFHSLSGPTCSGEVCSFRDLLAELPDITQVDDLEVVGISSDPIQRLATFAEKNGISYPLLSDPDRKAQALYGVKPIMFGLVNGRETFFINESGRISGRHIENWAFRAISHKDFIEKQLLTAEESK